jgi:hypothetical protein
MTSKGLTALPAANDARERIIGVGESESRADRLLQQRLFDVDGCRELSVEGRASHAQLTGDVRYRRVWGGQRKARELDLRRGERASTSAVDAAPASRAHAGDGAFADQLAFELGDRAEDPVDELAGRRGGVDRLDERA